MPYAKDHKAKSKDRILRSATELFCRYGFNRVSISEIMKLAKMTHGAFYAHFESKEALYRSSFVDALQHSRAARLVKGPLSMKNLKNLVSDYLSLRSAEKPRDPGPEAILFNEYGNDNAEVKQLFGQSYDNLRKILERRITALSRLKGAPPAPDRDLVTQKARAIIASMVGAVAIAKSIPNEAEKADVLAAAQRQILVMLGLSEDEIEALLEPEEALAR